MSNKKTTLSDIEREERAAIKLEIKARQELAKRMEHPLKLLKTAAEKEQQKRKERIEHLTEYKSYNEAQEPTDGRSSRRRSSTRLSASWRRAQSESKRSVHPLRLPLTY